MKTTGLINYIKVLVLILTLTPLFTACETDDSEKEWGYAKVYMPQAAILNGGLNNNYPVPLSNNPSTENYEIDEATNTLNILLGVYRSGLQKLEDFSVKVSVDKAATEAALPDVSRGVVLPDDVYTLPTEISVANGEREKTFYLSVDLNKLEQQYAHFNKSRMVLVVRITDPTRYELNENLAQTTIIINGSSFLPAPLIVKGGDFADGSETNWTMKNLDTSGVFDESFATTAGGYLTFSFGEGPVTANIAYYQPIELTAGTTYKLAADFSASGGAKDGQFFICVSQTEPQDGEYYGPESGMFANIDSWQSAGITNPVSGKMPEVGTWVGGGMDKSGLFTPASDGQYYLIMVAACWGGNIGSIIIDNLVIEEL